MMSVLIHAGGAKTTDLSESVGSPANFTRLAMAPAREGGKPVALIGGIGDETDPRCGFQV